MRCRAPRQSSDRVNQSQLPAFATLRGDHFLRAFGVEHPEVCSIPVQSLSRTDGQVAKKKRFGDHSREFEIPAGLDFSALRGIQPFAFIAGRAWQGFWRLFVGLHLGLRYESWMRAVESAQNLAAVSDRSEEHTSELQSHSDLVCRLLLEKKKNKQKKNTLTTIRTQSAQPT